MPTTNKNKYKLYSTKTRARFALKYVIYLLIFDGYLMQHIWIDLSIKMYSEILKVSELTKPNKLFVTKKLTTQTIIENLNSKTKVNWQKTAIENGFVRATLIAF